MEFLLVDEIVDLHSKCHIGCNFDVDCNSDCNECFKKKLLELFDKYGKIFLTIMGNQQ
jgi:hypothetical protein